MCCREQGEKFNVWVALLNLENTYADDPEEAAAALLKRALQHNSSKKVYLAATDIFERSNRQSLLDSCAKGMRRKHGESCKVWLRLLRLSLTQGKDASSSIEKATRALPRRKHVKFLAAAALHAFKHDSQDFGRSIFESLLQTYPKRTDVWGMYIDQEIKLGQEASVRNLFERAIHLDLPAKKMRFFFKRYVAYEADHGTEERVEYVKKRALEYIESQNA
jgi:rRNA biogenesis protein RRP5